MIQYIIICWMINMLMTDMWNNSNVVWSWIDTARHQLRLQLGSTEVAVIAFFTSQYMPDEYQVTKYTITRESLIFDFFDDLSSV